MTKPLTPPRRAESATARSPLVRGLWRWGPSLLLMGAIFFLSGLPDVPGPPDPLLNRIVKKSAHAIGYGLLAISYARALGARGWRGLALALALTLLYAISDEWHQTFVPRRTGNPLDVLIDLAGGVVGLVVWQRVQQRQQLDPAP